jgi:branched-chain amino acid transport system permease protein
MQKLIFGAVLVFIAIFRPQGLIPAKNRKVDPAKLEQPSDAEITLAESQRPSA